MRANVISNLVGPEPEVDWIGRRVAVVYEDHPGGYVVPRMQLV